MQGMRGEGVFAELLAQRYRIAVKKLDLNQRDSFRLECEAFCPPGGQIRYCDLGTQVRFSLFWARP